MGKESHDSRESSAKDYLPSVPAPSSASLWVGYYLVSGTFVAVVQTPSVLKRSSLPLWSYNCFKLRLSYAFHLRLSLSVLFILLTTVTARRIRRWIFSWPVLRLAWNNCETKIGESVSHSYLTSDWSNTMIGLLYLLHRSVCVSEVSVMLLEVIVCFLKELCIFYTIKVKFSILYLLKY